jgi:DNA-binding transcriptional regulator PaaX
MSNLNSNDYRILACVVDKEKNRGLAIGRGSTLKQIVEKTGLSIVKVRNTIMILLEEGLILEGIKKAQAKSYCMSENGAIKLKELQTNIKY